jgi:hypothetical protein
MNNQFLMTWAGMKIPPIANRIFQSQPARLRGNSKLGATTLSFLRSDAPLGD